MVFAKAVESRVLVRLDDRAETPPSVISAVKRALRAGAARFIPDVKAEIELIIAGEETVRSLNASQRGKDSVTDVLSFPELDLAPGQDPSSAAGPTDVSNGRIFLGSIVICAGRAYAQAEEFAHSPEREFSFLAVHSLLHLLGWDHERSESEEKEMFSLQESVLRSAGIGR
ncbi:MAG: rRNA maturation RNase YbeY [Clostridiales bacterium]|nr:rRNA maturation RNase YbeY [Clostridiales bacterium]